MQTDPWKRAEEIFHEVVDLDSADRDAHLQMACAGDAALREDVESLLAAHEASEAHQRSAAPPVREPEIQRIGPYLVERELGEGGMGTVFLASRDDQQYEKKVAIKLVRAGAGTDAMIQRFLTERQILAGLEHPNIARLLDGALTEAGQPYLVMDYVVGTRLDVYCDTERLPIRKRVELFRKICLAVTYAHENLVIHRDLKPSNILVTGEGEPKLLDFGIAKVLDPVGTAIEHTMTAGLFLTPLYASPELLRGQKTTVASDVYSLGVILYELLCGCRPHHAHTGNPAELIHAVITRDPDRPSTAWRSLEVPVAEAVATPETVALLRGETPDGLRRELRGDLDGIVMKAIAKEASERYSSVEQLSEDLRRYLESQPIRALRGSTIYRARKFARRHKLGVASAALVALSLIAGLAGTLWQAHIARMERVNADHRFDDAHKLANYLLFELYTSVQKLPGSTPVQAEMAGRTLEYYDRLSAAKSADRTLQAELAEGYLRLGDVLGNPFEKNLGDTPKAQQSYRKALAIAEPLAQTETADVRARLALAKIHQQLGGGMVFAGKPDEGLALVQKAADEFEHVVAVKPGDPQIRISAAQAYQFLGRNLSQRGGWVSTQDGDRAMASVRKSMEHIETALRAEPRNARALRIQAVSCQVIGNMLSTKDPTRSLEMYSRSLGILSSLPEPDRNGMDVRRLRASLLLNIGWDKGQKQQYRESIATLHEARDILDGIARDDPRDMAASYHRTAAYRNLGIVHGYAKEDAASLENYAKSVEILTSLSERDPANANYPLYRAEQQARMGNLLTRAGRMEEAERVARAGIGYLTTLAARPNAPSSQLQDAARYLMETEVKSLRNYPLALAYAKRANELTKGQDAGTLEYLAEAYWVNGDARAAADTIVRALALLPPPAAGEKPSRPRKMFQEELERYQKAAGAAAQSRK